MHKNKTQNTNYTHIRKKKKSLLLQDTMLWKVLLILILLIMLYHFLRWHSNRKLELCNTPPLGSGEKKKHHKAISRPDPGRGQPTILRNWRITSSNSSVCLDLHKRQPMHIQLHLQKYGYVCTVHSDKDAAIILSVKHEPIINIKEDQKMMLIIRGQN